MRSRVDGVDLHRRGHVESGLFEAEAQSADTGEYI